jgi:hypothetical protein
MLNHPASASQIATDKIKKQRRGKSDRKNSIKKQKKTKEEELKADIL